MTVTLTLFLYKQILMKTLVFYLVLPVALLLANGAYAQRGGAKVTGVYVSAVKLLAMVDKVESLGSLRANEAVSLASTVTELVTAVNFVDGQRVTKGDLLVQLDVSEELAQQAEEQARYQRAKRQVARFKPLIGRGAASEAALDDAKSEMQVAEARLNAIKSRIAQRQVVAPFDGLVGLRNISVGALTQPGMSITNIDDDSIMRLDFSVPEVFLGSLQIGNRVTATTSAFPGELYEGVVNSIDSRVNPVSRAIVVRARIPNSNLSLKPGLLMRVTLDRNLRQALVVQEEAIIADADRAFVLLATAEQDQYRAERRKVVLGARRKGEVEILSGLEVGDLVITHGAIKVRDGSLISILAEEKNDETLSELLQKADIEKPSSDIKEGGSTSSRVKDDQASDQIPANAVVSG
ncbi:MAG: membrane fusion protein (multidrug efflux system) [Arenicella sp.]